MSRIGTDFRLSIDHRGLATVAMVSFSGWMLAFPFQGQVLLALAADYGMELRALLFGCVAAHLVGLSAAGYLIKTMRGAKNLMLYACVIGVACSCLFFFGPSLAWYALLLAGVLAGMFVAAWGFYYRDFTPPPERLQTAAVILIYSNLLMIGVNMMALHLSPEAGLAAAIALLVFAFFFILGLPEQTPPTHDFSAAPSPAAGKSTSSLWYPLGLLCLFIFVLTINSGLMYQVINPAFAHHQWLVSWYWAVPYVAALQILRQFLQATNRALSLYIAIAMIGLAFLFFMTLDRSAPAYLVVNTLMMGACGIFDLFWWSILGGMLDLTENPARIMGWGLSANVLGVLLGGIIGSAITGLENPPLDPSVLALGIAMIALIILPLLHQRLSSLLKDHAFLASFSSQIPLEQTAAPSSVLLAAELSEREQQVVGLLSRGCTYKLIAAELYLSENTVKTHVKNAYSKLGVKNRTELVKLLMEQT
jgi:DNA-binding CsgD family transcriptional regulator